MPRVGLESTIPVFEQAKSFRALDHDVTMIGSFRVHGRYFNCTNYFLGFKYTNRIEKSRMEWRLRCC
jgi:hypothetical protein